MDLHVGDLIQYREIDGGWITGMCLHPAEETGRMVVRWFDDGVISKELNPLRKEAAEYFRKISPGSSAG